MTSITRIPAHVQTAATQGMKAGYRQFEKASSKSGLAAVESLWAEFAPLGAKPRFSLYCSLFGPKVDAIQATVAPRTMTTRSTPKGRVKNAVAAPIQEDRKLDEVQQLIETANALLAEAARLSGTKATKAVAPVQVEAPVRIVTPAEPKAPITYKQAMYLRFVAGMAKGRVNKLTQGAASNLIAEHKAAA